MRIERRCRLVAEQDVRRVDQRAGDGDALALPSRELRGIGALLVREAHHLQRFTGAAGALGSGDARDFQREGDIVERGRVRKEIELLENHADGTARRAQLRPAERAHHASVHPHLARARLLEQVDQAHQRRFARAREAEQADDLTGLDREIGRQKRVDETTARRKTLGDAPELDGGRGAHAVAPFGGMSSMAKRRLNAPASCAN